MSDETDDSSGCVRVQEDYVTRNGSRGEADFEEQREDDKETANCGSEFKNEGGKVSRGMTDRGAPEDWENNKTAVIGRKWMGRPRKKKKKAYNTGMATYDRKLQTVRLKEEVAPEVVHVFPVHGDGETEQASQENLMGNMKLVSQASSEFKGRKKSGIVHNGSLEQSLEQSTSLSGVVSLSANSGRDKGGRKDISKNSPTILVYRTEESTSTSVLPGFKKDRNSRQNIVNEFGGTDTDEVKVDRSLENRTEVGTHAEIVKRRTTLLKFRKPKIINDVRSMQSTTPDVSKTIVQLESQEAMRKPPARSNTDDGYATACSGRSQSAAIAEVISGKNFTSKANSVSPLPEEDVKESSPQPTSELAVQQPTSRASKRHNQFKLERTPGPPLRKPVRSISTNNGSACVNSHDSRSATSNDSQSFKGTTDATNKVASPVFDVPIGKSNLPADMLRNSDDGRDRIDVSGTLEPTDCHAAASFACEEQPSIPSSQGAMNKPPRTFRDLPQTQIELPADRLRRAASRSNTKLEDYNGTLSVAPLPSGRMKNNCNNGSFASFDHQSAIPFSLESMKGLVSEHEVVLAKHNNHASKSIEADAYVGQSAVSLPKVVIQTSMLIEAQVIEPVLEALPESAIEQVGQVFHQVGEQIYNQAILIYKGYEDSCNSLLWRPQPLQVEDKRTISSIAIESTGRGECHRFLNGSIK